MVRAWGVEFVGHARGMNYSTNGVNYYTNGVNFYTNAVNYYINDTVIRVQGVRKTRARQACARRSRRRSGFSVEGYGCRVKGS